MNIIAIVGRPNVGKSTLMNRICGKKVSIVDDTAGVTRDRLFCDCCWCGKNFTLIDTGGLDNGGDELTISVKKQALDAVENADCIIFVVDAKQGVMPYDLEIAEILRRSSKKIVVAVNKADAADKSIAYEFYSLGLGDPLLISAEHGYGVGDLLDNACSDFPIDEISQPQPLKIAIVGKPNVGKSSIVNKLCGYERSIVSNVAGTTRDAADTLITVDGNDYILIDTAGIRRKRDVKDGTIERYAVLRAIAAIKRADVAVIVLDATTEISEQDEKIAGLVHDQGKPSVIVLNKWDALQKDGYTLDNKKLDLKEHFAFMDYFSALSISAKSGQRVDKILSEAEKSFANASRRISTGLLNDIVNQATSATQPPSKKGKTLKIYYATQPSTLPPLFVFKVNDAKLVHFSYERYLENCLRKAIDFSGTPIKLKFVGKGDEK